MAVSINGVSKSKTTSTTDSYYGVDSSVLIQMSKDYNKLLETLTKKTAESSKITDELGYKIDEAFEFLRTRAAEVDKLNERAQKTYKNLSKLTNEQRELALEELKKDIAITFDSFKKVPEEMTDFMATFGKVRGAADFRRTFEDISSMSKKVEAIASQNKKIVERNEAIEASRKRLYGDVVGEDWNSGIKGLGKSALYGALGSAAGALGPFSALLKPVGSFLKKEAPTIFGALRPKKRVITPSESMLQREGVVGSAAVYLGRTMKDTLGNEESKSGSLLDIFSPEGVKKWLPAIPAFPTTFTLGSISSALLKGGALAVALWFLGDTVESFFTKDYEDVNENAYAKGYEKAIDDLGPLHNSFTDHISNFPEILAGSLADALAEEGFWKGLGTFVKSVWNRSADRTESYDKGLIEGGLAAFSEESGMDYDEVRLMYNNDLMIARLTGNWNAFWEKWKDQAGVVEGVVGTPQMVWTDAEIEAMKKQAEEATQPKNPAVNDNPMVIWENGIPKPNPDYVSPFDSILNPTLGLPSNFTIQPFPLNDAIIYKDNSVYVPHPDDNIVLTKDDVSTPVLSNSFEGTLFDILNKIASNNTPSVVTVQPSYSAFDFSSLRI